MSYRLDQAVARLLQLAHEHDLSQFTSAEFIGTVIGADLRGCPFCACREVTHCPACRVPRCERCAKSHDHSPLCDGVAEYARIHAVIRLDDARLSIDDIEPEPLDYFMARKAFAAHLLQRTVC